MPPMVAESRAPRSTPTAHPAASARRAVEVLDGRQPQRGEDHLAAARDRAAHQAGVAALGHHADARLGTGPQDTADLLGRAGSHDGQRLAAEAPRPIGLVAGAQRRIGQTVAVADDAAQSLDQVHRRESYRHGACARPCRR
jgi:hypothetical protein